MQIQHAPVSSDKMSFAMQLRKARNKAGLSIADAAQQAGVSPRTWAHWEKGQRLPPAERDAITRERLLARLTSSGKRLIAARNNFREARRRVGAMREIRKEIANEPV